MSDTFLCTLFLFHYNADPFAGKVLGDLCQMKAAQRAALTEFGAS